MANNARAAEELEHLFNNLKNKDEGLKTELAVRWASQHPNSELYSRLTWDDARAGHMHRLSEMRRVISVVQVTYKKKYDGETIEVHAYKSLSDHRGDKGGYLPFVKIMSNKELRYRLLLDTIQRLSSMEDVDLFPELLAIKKEIAKAREKYPEGSQPEAPVRRAKQRRGSTRGEQPPAP